MNCSEFQHMSHELARDRVEGREKIEALAHAEECSRCAEYLQEERRLSLRLGFLSQVMQAREAPAQLESALMAAFREQAAQASENGSIPLHAGPRYWARQRFWAWGAGAAALAAILALVIGLESGNRVPSQTSSGVASSTQGPKAETAPVTSAIVKQQDLKERQPVIRVSKRGHAVVQGARAARDEETTLADSSGFIPLVYCDELNCGTPGDVVRVELPASSLPIMGFASTNVTGPIRADVVVGEDGVARAIHLVDY
jgi:hypothetical protein